MADYTTEFEGLAEVQQMLRDAPRRIVEKYFPAALKAGAAVIEAELHSRTPESAGPAKDGKHLRDSLVVEVEIPSQGLTGTADVGYGNEGYKAIFVEYGHRSVAHGATFSDRESGYEGKLLGESIPAHPFMRPGTDAAAEGAIAAFSDSLAEQINNDQ